MQVLLKAGALLLLALSSPFAAAQAYPSKSIRIIVNYPPGGTTDLVARTVGTKVGEYNGQTVTIENRPGANGAVGSLAVARSVPDGYTLMFTTAGHTAISYALEGNKLPFNPFKDFAPITLLVVSPQIIIVHPSLDVRSIPELVKLAKSRAKDFAYGSAGSGTPNHLGVELLKHMAGFEMTHVPYKGGAQAVADLVAGRVHLMLNSMVSVMPHVKSGKVVAIAMGRNKRSPVLPDLPTVAEQGYPAYNVSTWYGMSAPAGTPRPIIDKLNADMNKALVDPQASALLTKAGVVPEGSTPEELGKLMREEYESWVRVIKAANIRSK